MRYIGDPKVRRQVTQTLAMHGFAPDDLYLEDAIALLEDSNTDDQS